MNITQGRLNFFEMWDVGEFTPGTWELLPYAEEFTAEDAA